MTPQTLDRVLTSYRIGDPSGAYPIFDAFASTASPGRWNTAKSPVLYTSEHYSTALLEKLVHANGILPPNQHFIEITIPNKTTYEVLDQAALPDWADASATSSKAFGEAWQQSGRSLLLIVPSVVARPDRNFLLNPHHPQFGKLQPSLHQPVWWDRRLLGAATES
ncbi:MAG TPA: RES domain-containing protein [Alphaproteobacteria bacterium]|nr:RES domain-containing protein [Alphaproteobacteria bacterium]